MRPTLVLLAAVAGIAACTHPVPPASPATSSARSPAAATPSAPTAAMTRGAAPEIVRTLCFTCHTEQAPPKTAPPFAMVAMRYRHASADSAAAVARIVAYVRAPARERSLLPPMAIERFGLMPPLALPDSTLRAAAEYIMSLGAAAPGARHRHGMRH